MTRTERNKRIAELQRRKDAATWKFIGACMEINEQIDILRATPTEEVEWNESCKKAEA